MLYHCLLSQRSIPQLIFAMSGTQQMSHVVCLDLAYILSCIGSDYTGEARSEISQAIDKLPSYGLSQECQDKVRELLTRAHSALVSLRVDKRPEHLPSDLVFYAYREIYEYFQSRENESPNV